MTTTARPAAFPANLDGPALLRARVLAIARPWEWLAFSGTAALAAVLYLWNLTVSGYANAYYSAAALAASKSWSAFFFGSFDAANFITVDKPPASIWLMGLSVRLFGLSPLSILLPQALAGVATVAILFVAVRHSFGGTAATIAAVAMALTPAAVLMFRYNNPDALLTLLLVAAAWALLRSLEAGSYRWVAFAAGLVGLAFLTKYLQAYLVLPGFALVYGFSANASLRRRIGGLAVAAASVAVTSGWWVAIVQAIPLGSRPFIGGSTSGSPLDLIFGYDGLGRIFGNSAGNGGGGGGANFSGTPGLLRLFNDQLFGQIAWFIPLAIVGLVVGLWLRRSVERTDRGLAGYLVWGTWFATTAVILSYMDGTMHSYYAVALAPAVAALAGAGLVDLWSLRAGRLWIGGVAAGLALLATAWFGWQLLGRTPAFATEVGPIAVVLAGVALVVLAVVSLPRLASGAPSLRTSLRTAALGAAGVGLAASLLAPAAYAASTMNSAISGGDPHPGPGAASGFGARGGFGGAAPGGAPGAGPGGSFDGGGDGNSADSALVDYLVANRGAATWIVAVSGSGQAGAIELATGLPVMAMGGFTGSDPWPTLGALQAYVRSGQLRYVIVGGADGFGGRGFGGAASSSVSTWVTSSCSAVTINGSSTSLYDCSSAASS